MLMTASKALISGVALQEVCDAAGWSSLHTLIRFYYLDLDSIPGSQVLLSLMLLVRFHTGQALVAMVVLY